MRSRINEQKVMEKLKDVDTWGAECQHYLSPEVKTMDGFVFRHLKDCGFLDYRSNRKMTSSPVSYTHLTLPTTPYV